MTGSLARGSACGDAGVLPRGKTTGGGEGRVHTDDVTMTLGGNNQFYVKTLLILKLIIL